MAWPVPNKLSPKSERTIKALRKRKKEGRAPKNYIDLWLQKPKLRFLTIMSKEGMTDAEIADKIGITPKTIRKWKAAHPEIAEALSTAPDEAAANVKASLLELAMGAVSEECIYEVDEDGNEKLVKKVVKRAAPDLGAAKTWLKVKCGEEGWDDTTIKMGVTDDFASVIAAARERVALNAGTKEIPVNTIESTAIELDE